MSDTPNHHVCVSLSGESYSNVAYLIGPISRGKIRRVIGEVNLTGFPSVGYEATENETQEILWEIANAAAAILEKHLPRLQALKAEADRARETKAFGRTDPKGH